MTLAIQHAESDSTSELKAYIHREIEVLSKIFVTKVEFEPRLAAVEDEKMRETLASFGRRLAAPR